MIEVVIVKLKSWSLAVLPVLGYLIGQLLQFALGTRGNRQLEALMVHLITVILLVFIAASSFANNDTLKEPGDKIFFVAVSYLFILGTVLGLISIII